MKNSLKMILIYLLVLIASCTEYVPMEPETQAESPVVRRPGDMWDFAYWQNGDSLYPVAYIRMHEDSTLWWYTWAEAGPWERLEVFGQGEKWVRTPDGWIEIPFQESEAGE